MSYQTLPVIVIAALLILTSQAQASENAITIKPRKGHEDCFAVNKGDRIKLTFTTDNPVKFNVHYHQGNDVVYAYPNAITNNLRLNYKARVSEQYCLLWRSRGQSPTQLSYHYEIQQKVSD